MNPDINTVTTPTITTTQDLSVLTSVSGLWIWALIIVVAWFAIQLFLPNRNSRLAEWVWLILSILFFFIFVHLPEVFSTLFLAVFTIATVWSLHTVPISFILGFYYRHRISLFDTQAARIQGYGQIYSQSWLGVVIQRHDLSEHSLSYTELLKLGLQISDYAPQSEWHLTLPEPLTPVDLRNFERAISQMAWFSISPAPTIWPQPNQTNTLIVRATLLRSQDYARVIQVFYRTLHTLSQSPPS